MFVYESYSVRIQSVSLQKICKCMLTTAVVHSLLCIGTLKSLIEEHARLDFSDFLSTLLAILYVINANFLPACLLIYLVNKQAVWLFFPTLLIYSGLLVY